MHRIDSFFTQNSNLLYKFLLILPIFIAIQSASAQMVDNGDFETGDFTGWVNSGNIFVLTSPVISGNWSLDFNGGDTVPNGEFSQSVTTNIGESYRLTFKFGYLGLNNSQQVHVQIDGVSGVGSLIDSSVIMTVPYTSPGTFSESFTADTTNITLRFTDDPTNSSFGSDMVIDDISIQSLELIFTNSFE